MSHVTIRPLPAVLVIAAAAIATYLAVSVFQIQNRLNDFLLSDGPSPAAMQKPAMEKPAMEKPAMTKPAMEKPVTEEPAPAKAMMKKN